MSSLFIDKVTYNFCKLGKYSSLDNVEMALPDKFL